MNPKPTTSHTQKLAICLFSLALLSACTRDPLEAKLAPDGRLTKSEVEAISAKLVGTDASMFKRWAERMNRGESFGGEGTALTVRLALLNQQTYETQQAELLAKAQAEAKAQKDREAQALREAEAVYTHRQEVNLEVRKYIDATIPTYRPQTFYDRYDRPVSGIIEFSIRLKNRAQVASIGIAGFVTIKDVFGRDLGSYPFALEPRIGPGQTIIYNAILDFDPRNEQHQVLWRAKNIVSSWFFESAAFEDGTRIDSEYVTRKRAPSVAPKSAAKGSNT